MAGPAKPALRVNREAVVVEHMESENRHDFDATIGTFAHLGNLHGFPPTGRAFSCRTLAIFGR